MATPDVEKEIKLYLKDELKLMADNFYRFMMGYKQDFFAVNNLAHMKKAVINRMSEEDEDFQKFNSIDFKDRRNRKQISRYAKRPVRNFSYL